MPRVFEPRVWLCINYLWPAAGVPEPLSWSAEEGSDCHSQGVPSDVAQAVDVVVVLGGEGTPGQEGPGQEGLWHAVRGRAALTSRRGGASLYVWGCSLRVQWPACRMQQGVGTYVPW